MADNEYIKRSEVVALIEDELRRCEIVLEALDLASLRTKVMRLRSADVAPRAEWISVEERLPEPKKWVLVFTRHMHHPVVCFYEDVWYFLGGFFSKGQVTHWMPLPEPLNMKGDAE